MQNRTPHDVQVTNQGAKAFSLGHALSENPYERLSIDSDLWIDGWTDARDKSMSDMERVPFGEIKPGEMFYYAGYLLIRLIELDSVSLELSDFLNNSIVYWYMPDETMVIPY